MPNQKERMAYFMNKIRSIGLCESIITEYPGLYQELHVLFKDHPDDEKLRDHTDFKIIINEWNDYCVGIQYRSKKPDTISIKTCIKKTGWSDKQYRDAVMRYEVEDQVKEYRKNNQVCEKCGTFGCLLEVDHCGDFEFRHIRDMFLEKHKMTKADFKKIKQQWRMKDREIAREWCDFHKKYAVYQMLCLVCHKKKTHC